MISPTVLSTPHGTAHTLYRVILYKANCYTVMADLEIRLTIHLLVIIFNTIELIILFCHKYNSTNRRKAVLLSESTVAILTSLSFADLLLGLSGSITYSLIIAGYSLPSWVHITIFHFSAASSVLNLSVLTFDRLIAIFTPLKHRSIVSTSKLRVALIAAWMISFLVTGTELCLFLLKESWESQYVWTALVLPTLFILFGAYSAIFWKLRRISRVFARSEPVRTSESIQVGRGIQSMTTVSSAVKGEENGAGYSAGIPIVIESFESAKERRESDN